MAGPAKKIVKIVLILSLGICTFVSADVKLRIYMQDGSLRAGNMVDETDQNFVILSKSGREEIPKNKIMYVNGKTLAQWQARPDKLFQTEILPSEIPNPAYVNDKASLPTVPALPKKENVSSAGSTPAVAPITGAINLPAAVPVKTVVVPTKTVAANPSPSVKAESSPKVEEAPKVAVSPAPVASPVAAIKEEPKPVVAAEKPVVVKAPVVRASATRSAAVVPAKVITPMTAKPAPPVVQAAPAAPVKTEFATVRPRGFAREAMADFHMKKALECIQRGYQGQAIQELHMATMLNKANEEGFLLLGKLYQEEGAKQPAEKILKMPILKKNAEAKKHLDDLETATKAAEKSKLILQASTAAGALVGFGLVMLVRRKKKPITRIIDAESLDVSPAEIEKAQIENPIMNLIDQIESPPAVPLQKEPAFMKPALKPTPPMKKETKPEAPPPLAPVPEIAKIPAPEKILPPVEIPPVAPNPVVAQKNEQASVEREAIQKALEMAKHAVQKNIPPVFKVELPPSSPILTNPAASPEPTFDDREEAIKVGQKGDQTLQQAHTLAYEGKWELARKGYRTTLALKPASVEPYLGLGYVDFSEERWESAMYHYRKALEMNPNSPDAYYGIGRVLLETKQAEKAIEFLRKALQMDPQFNDARDTLALLGKAA